MKESSLCRQVRAHASDWRDRRLNPDTTSLIDEHLRACTICRKEFEFESRIASAARDGFAAGSEFAVMTELPARMKRTLIERAITESNKAPWQRQLSAALRSTPWRRVASAAAIVILIFGAYAVGFRQGQDRPSTTEALPVITPLTPNRAQDIGFDRSASRLLEGLGLSDVVRHAWSNRKTGLQGDAVRPRTVSEFRLASDPHSAKLVRAGREIPLNADDRSLIESLGESDDCELILEESRSESGQALRIEIRRFGGGRAEVSITRSSRHLEFRDSRR